MVRSTARPPSRSTPPRRSLRALEPVSTKRGGNGSSRTAWMTVSSSGTRWISSITTVSLPGEPASSSLRRSGWAPRLRCSAGSSRSRYRASVSWSRNHVDLPVPRGPSRKQLWSGIRKNRLTISILRRKMEFQIPIFAQLAPKINRLSWNERAASCFRNRYGVNSRTPVSLPGRTGFAGVGTAQGFVGPAVTERARRLPGERRPPAPESEPGSQALSELSTHDDPRRATRSLPREALRRRYRVGARPRTRTAGGTSGLCSNP